MSRIGKKIVTIPKGVEIKVDGEHLEVKGPKGSLREKIHPAVKIEIKTACSPWSRCAKRRATTRCTG